MLWDKKRRERDWEDFFSFTENAALIGTSLKKGGETDRKVIAKSMGLLEQRNLQHNHRVDWNNFGGADWKPCLKGNCGLGRKKSGL